MHLCSKRPESTLTASRAVAAVHVHSEESRKPSPSGFPNLNNSLVPPPCHSVGTRMLTSLTSEQRHCTIQFTLYIKSAKKKKKRGVEELRGRQYLYSWGPKLIWQVAWLWGIGSTASVAESEWNTNLIGGLYPFSLSTQRGQGWKPETLNCWEKPLLPLCLVSPFCHMIHVYLVQLLGYPATCSLETAIPLGLRLEGRWTLVKGYEDVMRDNLTKKIRETISRWLAWNRLLCPHWGQATHLTLQAPRRSGPGCSPLWDTTELMEHLFPHIPWLSYR